MKEELFSILKEVRRPSRYLGNEINSVRKDLDSVALRVCLAYPDAYEIGMSNIGLSILYHLLNDRPEIACERVFAPWPDLEGKLRERQWPLASLESGLPLKDFDILGISLPYELTYTNILTILNLGGIPLLAAERNEDHPLILGGGTGAFNPEPVADFFDAILIGDGEEAILEICDVVRQWKQATRRSRTELLRTLATIRGVYVPSFLRFHYREDGTIREIEPLVGDYTGVAKRTVSDLDTAAYPTRPILPHTRVIHDRIGVEVQRGCVRGCRFCQAGYIYRPERQRSPETVKEIVRNQIQSTGQEAVSLVSLSIGDYDCLTPLLEDLMDEHGAKKVSISLPATRVEQLTPALMEEIKRVRKTGFTIAPEAATDRMRNVINKGNSEENLLTTTRAVFQNGWDLMKFYFMIGLPTETDEDVVAIATLGRKALALGRSFNRRAEINLGVSPFVPKPFTPFQWEGQIGLEETHRRLDLLRSRLVPRGLHMKPHRPEATYLEGIFSRGDRRLSRLLLLAWEKGCRFDEWDEGLRFEKWQEAWTELGIDPAFYVERRRGKDEILPWDHLFVEMKKEWLWSEYEASLEAGFIDDCSTGKCTVCGVCDYKEVRNRAYELPVYDASGKAVRKRTTTEIRVHRTDPPPEGRLTEEPCAGASENESRKIGSRSRVGDRHEEKSNSLVETDFSGRIERAGAGSEATFPPGGGSVRCTFSKTGPAVFLSHLEFVDHIRRAVARAGLAVKFSQGFHPLPRISFGQAMAVGREYRDQEFRIELESGIDPTEIATRLNDQLPEGIVVSLVEPIEVRSPLTRGGESVSPPLPTPPLSPSL